MALGIILVELVFPPVCIYCFVASCRYFSTMMALQALVLEAAGRYVMAPCKVRSLLTAE